MSKHLNSQITGTWVIIATRSPLAPVTVRNEQRIEITAQGYIHDSWSDF